MTISIWLLSAGVCLAGPTPGAATQTSRAAALYQKRDWSGAARAYQAVVRRSPHSGQAWYRLGSARYQLKQYRQAEAAWRRAERAGFHPPVVRYNLAAVNALLGRRRQAFTWLQRAIDAGFSDVRGMQSDADFRSLRADPRFRRLVAAADKKARPCHFDARARQFDFWLGDWKVFNPQGKQVGTSHIQLLAGQCAVLESWTDARGSTGNSLNYVDPTDGHWKQVWVNDKGGRTLFSGQLQDGAMHFEGRAVTADGKETLQRMIFTPLPDGRVRQHIDVSRDGGKTWTAGFDGTYRHPTAPARRDTGAPRRSHS